VTIKLGENETRFLILHTNISSEVIRISDRQAVVILNQHLHPSGGNKETTEGLS